MSDFTLRQQTPVGMREKSEETCANMTRNIHPASVRNLKPPRKQAKSQDWHTNRAGRITSSFYNVRNGDHLHRDNNHLP
ncbi:hypothetical protein ABVT39_023993 [Epinephelus coioides]